MAVLPPTSADYHSLCSVAVPYDRVSRLGSKIATSVPEVVKRSQPSKG